MIKFKIALRKYFSMLNGYPNWIDTSEVFWGIVLVWILLPIFLITNLFKYISKKIPNPFRLIARWLNKS